MSLCVGKVILWHFSPPNPFFQTIICLNEIVFVDTGEKPFKCTYCEYATAQNSTLKIHLRRHHDKAPPGSSSVTAAASTSSCAIDILSFPPSSSSSCPRVTCGMCGYEGETLEHHLCCDGGGGGGGGQWDHNESAATLASSSLMHGGSSVGEVVVGSMETNVESNNKSAFVMTAVEDKQDEIIGDEEQH